MNKLVVFVFIIILFISNSNSLNAQDVHFSQFNNAPLMINPALAGEFKGQSRFILYYKDQWSSISNNPYKTYAFSSDFSFLKDKLSSGILVFNDKAGDGNMGITEISVPIASKVQINSNDFLKLGLQGTWSQHSLNMSSLTWNNQYDGNIINPALSSGEKTPANFSYFDVSSGILWNHHFENKTELNLGVSAFHLLQPKFKFLSENQADLNIRWCGYGNMSINLKKDNIILYPSMLVLVQGVTKEVDLGAMVKYKVGIDSRYTGFSNASYVCLGSYYRYNDAFIFYTSFNYKSQLNFGFSYDVNVSKLNTASNAKGGLELSLIYIIPDKALIKL